MPTIPPIRAALALLAVAGGCGDDRDAPRDQGACRTANLAGALAVAALLVGAACTDPDSTSVRLRVFAEPILAIDQLTLHAGDAPPEELAPMPELRVLVPGDWAGHPTDFTLDGFSADELVASGTVRVVPALHAEVSADIALHELDCPATCAFDEVRCAGDAVETCVRGDDGCPTWGPASACPASAPSCANGTCGTTCTPGVNTCQGADVVRCDPDGTLGDVVETCAAGSVCAGGACQRSCTTDGVDLIYVVDDTHNLLSFDPRLVGAPAGPFHLIGRLSCPAGATLPGFGTGAATPYSMGVDRDGNAWVLYSSGQLFKVSTTNAQCTATAFTPQQTAGRRWDLFGMGFVTDTAGGSTERLWIGGGDTESTVAGDLGWLTPGALAINHVGPLSATVEYSPELTGLGDATLWGLYPGRTQAFVQQIDKSTGGGIGNRLSIPGGLGNTVAAWAFAQWGGTFYVFVTTLDAQNNPISTVRTLDRATGAYRQLLTNIPYRIVGAGVSTCAPVSN